MKRLEEEYKEINLKTLLADFELDNVMVWMPVEDKEQMQGDENDYCLYIHINELRKIHKAGLLDVVIRNMRKTTKIRLITVFDESHKMGIFL